MTKSELKELCSKIIPAFSEEMLSSIPQEERANYMNIKVFPIQLLVKADWNYKEENEAMSEKLRANLKRNGQIENIHLRLLPTGYYEVVNGNHRYDEMLALGYSTVLAYDHGKCTKEEAIRKCLETNETIFRRDDLKLAVLIKQIGDHFDMKDLVESLPYTEDEIKNYQSLQEFKWEGLIQKTDEGEEEEQPMKKIVIQYPADQVGIVEEIGRLLHKFPGAKIQ